MCLNESTRQCNYDDEQRRHHEIPLPMGYRPLHDLGHEGCIDLAEEQNKAAASQGRNANGCAARHTFEGRQKVIS